MKHISEESFQFLGLCRIVKNVCSVLVLWGPIALGNINHIHKEMKPATCSEKSWLLGNYYKINICQPATADS